MKQTNVFGTELETCSKKPITGFFRDGCCNTDKSDFGNHTVCVIVDERFLEFSRIKGNDLVTPQPLYAFPGLKPGDRWCLCAVRWKEAYDAGFAPAVVLQATNERVLDIIPMSSLLEFAHKDIAEK